MKKIKKVAIFPWAESSNNPYQKLFARGFEKINVEVVKPRYKKIFPIINVLYENEDIDALFLDWVHPFYTAPSLGTTLIKTFLGEIERWKLKNHTIPIIWNLHNLHRHDKLHLELEKWNFQRLAKIVDGIRLFNSVSEELAFKYLSIKDHNKLRIIPHGNYISTFEHLKGISIRKSLGIDENTFVLLIFGNIRRGKGILKFIQTISRVRNLSFKLIIAGKPESSDLVHEIKYIANLDSRIKYILRFISNEELLNLFHSSDFVVLPYEYILNSGAALTAMSCKMPIIANDLPVFQELLTNDFSFRGDLYNDKRLTKILQKAQSVKEIERMKEFAYKKAKEFSWERIAEDLCQFALEKNVNRR